MAIEFIIETSILRPPEEVFAVVTDPSRLGEWDPRVVEARADGPLRVGSRIREVRKVGPRRVEQLVEVTEFDAPRRFALRIVEGPFPLDGDLTFTPTETGTTVRLRAHGRGPRFLRLLEPLLARAARREMRAQYDRLKALVESQPAGDSSSSSPENVVT